MAEAAKPAPLTDRELEAITSAAAGYAKQHAGTIADRAHDGSPHAEAQRVRYASLLTGLDKLGVRLPNPLLEPQAKPDLAEIIRRAA